MSLPRFAVWLVGSCLLAVWASAQDEAASQHLRQRPGPPGALLCSGTEPSDPSCPRKRKAATLVPSFTKTTPHPTTHTTSHTTRSPANHTTVPANHTTVPANHTTVPANHTTVPANHTTVPTNHTTVPANHTTVPANHTTVPANHTTVPANPTTPHPTNHTTPFHTTALINHTTAHPINHTTPHHLTNHTTPPTTITTAPWPTDTPLVAVGNYVVKNGSAPCLRMEAGLQLQVQYTSKAKQSEVLWGTFAVQPNRTNASGACSSEAATLELHFPEGFLIFIFQKNETKGTSYLSRVQANLTYQFLQATETSFGADVSSLREFEASLGHSYQCRNQTLDLTAHFHLHVLKERVQAFKLQGGEFGEAEVCAEQRRPPILVIIVAVVLVLLVIVVLVAFAVGRRRSRTGYQTL